MFGSWEYDARSRYAACVPIEEQLEALAGLVAQGKVRAVGVSNETAFGLMKACHLGDDCRDSVEIATKVTGPSGELTWIRGGGRTGSTRGPSAR